MRKPSAIAGSAAFLILVPGVVAGLAPWLLTNGYGLPLSSSAAMIAAGSILVMAGLAVLLHSFARFAFEGAGTPAPIAPTERLIIGGAYRYVRNPMYVAVLSIIIGQALLFADWSLVLYAGVVAAAVFTFVRLYEEPTLARRYGDEYEAYRRAVPGWLPRLTPWVAP
ncbi:MAG TPA: isoprenylcysteine carboxylmethyltransferase family protein [Pseudaminobacter sp.]|jgi:protein-S-isoprenylcysteine O-methyltransferase Ste14|nr:isoprenylcysteine carboxylmethyltransferase family protein [Pseudaminobacter sp.]